jgi:guanylate kinase
MERVPVELELGGTFDYQIVNDVLERAIGEVEEIVKTYIQSS